MENCDFTKRLDHVRLCTWYVYTTIASSLARNYFLYMYLHSVGKIFFSKSKIWPDLNNLIIDFRIRILLTKFIVIWWYECSFYHKIKSAIINSSQVQKLFLFLQWLVALKITSSCSQLLGFYTQLFISAYSLVTVLQHLFFIFFWHIFTP